MPSPQRSSAWPDALCTPMGAELLLGKRVIAVDPEDEQDEDATEPPQEFAICTFQDGSILTWLVGPLAGPHRPLASDAVDATVNSLGVFFKRGINFRQYISKSTGVNGGADSPACLGASAGAATAAASLPSPSSSSTTLTAAHCLASGGSVQSHPGSHVPLKDGVCGAPEDLMARSGECSPVTGDGQQAAAAGGPRGGKSTRAKYTQAVAFDFVSDVMSSVLGPEDAQKAWSAASP